MNRFMYHESILFTQPVMKIAKMNRFTVLESQNQLSTNLILALSRDITLHRRG